MRPPARPLKAAVAGSRNDWLATGLSLQSPAYTARTVEDPELRFTPGGHVVARLRLASTPASMTRRPVSRRTASRCS